MEKRNIWLLLLLIFWHNWLSKIQDLKTIMSHSELVTDLNINCNSQSNRFSVMIKSLTSMCIAIFDVDNDSVTD